MTFNAAPDFESPGDTDLDNVYEVEVTADDGNGGTDVQLISVTVTDANDNPVITSANTVNSAENQTDVLTVTATDEDTPPQTISFSISGGADQTAFSIDAGTGELTFTTAPNFESPVDTNTDNVYEVEVTAIDGNGGSNTQLISVTVTDANDDPVITSPSAVNVPENQIDVLTVTATDEDLPAQTLSYLLTGGADLLDFAINPSSGAITFLAAPDFETPGDANADNVYQIEVTASDGNGGSHIQLISVTVTNDNEAPVVDNQSFAIDENSVNGTSVGSVVANDADAGDSLSYSITAGNTAGAFAINSSSGEITVANSPVLDFETTPTFDLTVRVQDLGGSKRYGHGARST